MDVLTRYPITGAMWREIFCFKNLGFQYRIFWGIVTSIIFRSYVFSLDLMVTLVLTWTSITKREMTHGGPYFVSNMILRLSVSLGILSLEIGILIFSWIWTQDQNLSKEVTNSILGIVINSIVFAVIRNLWNLFLLIGLTYEFTAFWVMQATDPLQFFEEQAFRISSAIRSILDEQKINRAMVIVSEPLEQETSCIFLFGPTFSLSSIALLHIFGIQIPILLFVPCWLWIMQKITGTKVGVTTGTRQIIRMLVDIAGIQISRFFSQSVLEPNINDNFPTFSAFLVLYMETRLFFNIIHSIPYLPDNLISNVYKSLNQIRDIVEWIKGTIYRIDGENMNKRKNLWVEHKSSKILNLYMKTQLFFSSIPYFPGDLSMVYMSLNQIGDMLEWIRQKLFRVDRENMKIPKNLRVGKRFCIPTQK